MSILVTPVDEVIADHFKSFDGAKQQHLQLSRAWTLWHGSPLCISWPWQKVFWLHKWGKFYFLATSWGIYHSTRLAAQPRSLHRCKTQLQSIITDLFQALASSQKEPFFFFFKHKGSFYFSRCGLFWCGQSPSPCSHVDFLWVFADQKGSYSKPVHQRGSVSLRQPWEGLLTCSPCCACGYLRVHVKNLPYKDDRWWRQAEAVLLQLATARWRQESKLRCRLMSVEKKTTFSLQWSKEQPGGKLLMQWSSVMLSGRGQGWAPLPPSGRETAAASTKDVFRKNTGSVESQRRRDTVDIPPDTLPQPHQPMQITILTAWYLTHTCRKVIFQRKSQKRLSRSDLESTGAAAAKRGTAGMQSIDPHSPAGVSRICHTRTHTHTRNKTFSLMPPLLCFSSAKNEDLTFGPGMSALHTNHILAISGHFSSVEGDSRNGHTHTSLWVYGRNGGSDTIINSWSVKMG